MREGLVERGEITFSDIMNIVRENSPHHGCAPLTALGEAQAFKLGSFWAPLLAKQAAEGKLHCFVSPQVRTLQTIGPLMQRLRDLVPSFKGCQLNTLLHEYRPPIAKEDLMRISSMPEVVEWRRTGQFGKVEAFEQSIRDTFSPAGLSGHELLNLANQYCPKDGNTSCWLDVSSVYGLEW